MGDLRTAVETVFRREGGRIIAGLIRASGSFDLAEDALQEAFAAALVRWQEGGVPRNPAALDHDGGAPRGSSMPHAASGRGPRIERRSPTRSSARGGRTRKQESDASAPRVPTRTIACG